MVKNLDTAVNFVVREPINTCSITRTQSILNIKMLACAILKQEGHKVLVQRGLLIQYLFSEKDTQYKYINASLWLIQYLFNRKDTKY